MGTENNIDERAALVAGLHELADFLAAHPEVPFPKHLSAGTNWWDGSDRPDDAKCIARIEAWKALGFTDDWPTGGEGHHAVKVTFGGFELRLSYVEDGKSHPIAWSKNVGESDKDFQSRVDAALEAVTTPTVPDNDEPAEDVPAVCDRCSMPAIQVDGVWQHAEAADAVFCAIVMGGAR